MKAEGDLGLGRVHSLNPDRNPRKVTAAEVGKGGPWDSVILPSSWGRRAPSQSPTTSLGVGRGARSGLSTVLLTEQDPGCHFLF